jgi:hypothetical protein
MGKGTFLHVSGATKETKNILLEHTSQELSEMSLIFCELFYSLN